MTKKILLSLSFVFPALLLLSCAGQVPPGGGPPDTIPPTVIFTRPDTNAVSVQTDRIILEFSEYVDRRSVEESIFISPYLGQLEFDWSGREVEISFSEQLKRNTTYVVNLGTDVVDIRARNRMASGFTLAFSTGEMIDQGVMQGRVFDDKPEGIMMFAYALGDIDPDTLDPSTTKPDYIMQTGKNGNFTFSNLRLDTYRIIAVRDEYRNLIYDKQIDQFGVTSRDVTLNDNNPQASDLWFRLSAEDTAKPFLTRVVPLTQTLLHVRFSEPLDTASFTKSTITLEDTVTLQPVGILLRSLDRSDSTAALVMTSTPLDSGRAYRLSVRDVRDKVGNQIDTLNASFVFVGVSTPDTLAPQLQVIGLRDSIRDVALEHPFEFRFSFPVRREPLTSAISLADSTATGVARSLQWVTESSVLLSPDRSLRSYSWYTIRVVMDSVMDYAGNSYEDSVLVIRFQTLNLATTGAIEGYVVDSDTGKNLGDVVLSTSRVAITPPVTRTLRLPEPGKFKFEHLPEGLYAIQAFRDRDSSGSYSHGRPFPFQPAERFAVYQDTVKVRARWSVEGVYINFKHNAKP